VGLVASMPMSQKLPPADLQPAPLFSTFVGVALRQSSASFRERRRRIFALQRYARSLQAMPLCRALRRPPLHAPCYGAPLQHSAMPVRRSVCPARYSRSATSPERRRRSARVAEAFVCSRATLRHHRRRHAARHVQHSGREKKRWKRMSNSNSGRQPPPCQAPCRHVFFSQPECSNEILQPRRIAPHKRAGTRHARVLRQLSAAASLPPPLPECYYRAPLPFRRHHATRTLRRYAPKSHGGMFTQPLAAAERTAVELKSMFREVSAMACQKMRYGAVSIDKERMVQVSPPNEWFHAMPSMRHERRAPSVAHTERCARYGECHTAAFYAEW